LTYYMSRTRRQPLPDWFSQYGSWRRQQWGKLGTGPGPLNPLEDVTKKNPDWDTLHQLFQGQQVTVDENHGIHDAKDLRGPSSGDVGGNFWSQKKHCFVPGSAGMKIMHFDATGVSGGNTYRMKYDGPLLATTPADSKFPVYTERNLGPYGTTAIARCKPTNSVAALSTTLAETIREGLPAIIGHTLWKGKTRAAKKAGDEFLNYEFGWLPLVSDIRSASYALANARKIIDSYERNSGKDVRRRYEFPMERTESNELIANDATWFSGSSSSFLTDASKPLPRVQKTTTFERRTWFSGAFTYHLPIGYNSRNWIERNYAQAGHLLGVELTPSVLWNLAPWSWAVDWVANLGDVIDNVSDWSTDGLVMRYGYIMEHTVQDVTYTMIDPSRYVPYGTHFASPLTFRIETKRRVKATPFGFGVTWNSFTPRQLAIAAALGISRAF
jgi:hypothetical protein